MGFRLLYSPLSQILSLHYFTVNPYTISEYKKAQNEINGYTDGQILFPVDNKPSQAGVFLLRNKHACQDSRDLEQIEIENNISFRVRIYFDDFCSSNPKCSEWYLSAQTQRI